MKKLKYIAMVIAISCFLFGFSTVLGDFPHDTVTNKSYWWTGGAFDPAIPWAQTIDNMVIGSKGTGNIYYVDSNVSHEGDGTSWTDAKDTLDEAVNLCTASNGDIIYVAQGHTETMGAAADEVDVDKAGITIIGCGTGDLMPKFDYTGDVTGAFAIGTDDVTIINLRFHANVTDVNEAIEVESGSTNVAFYGCLFDVESEGTDDFLECIDSVGGTADRLKVIDCQFDMGAGACNAAINTKDADYMIAMYNLFYGDYAVACIKNSTTASNHITIKYNTMFNGTIGGTAGLNAQPCIELVTTTTGTITHNDIFCNVATPDAAIVAADCFIAGNNYSETELDAAAPMWVTMDGAQNILGYNDNDNSYSSSSVAANADGSILERLEQIDTDTSAVVTDTAAMDTASEMQDLVDPNDIIHDAARITVCSATDLSSGWDTGDSPKTVATVTGDVLVQVVAIVQTNCTSTSNTGTLELGTTDSTAGLLVQDVVDNTAFQQGDVWTTGTAADNDFAALQDEWAAIGYGQDIIATIATNNMTAGAINFYIWWIPLSSGATVVSAL